MERIWIVRFEDHTIWTAGTGTEEEIRKRAEEKSVKEGHGKIEWMD